MCEKHQQRKRPATCPDCAAELEDQQHLNSERITNTDDSKLPPVFLVKRAEPVKEKILDTEEEKSLLEDTVDNIDTPRHTELSSVKSNKFSEREYISALVEIEIKKAIANIKAEVAELKNIKWEHMQIPLNTFRFEMLSKLESEGWKYCEMIKDPIAFQYGKVDPFILFTRVQRDNNPPIPKNFKRYLND